MQTIKLRLLEYCCMRRRGIDARAVSHMRAPQPQHSKTRAAMTQERWGTPSLGSTVSRAPRRTSKQCGACIRHSAALRLAGPHKMQAAERRRPPHGRARCRASSAGTKRSGHEARRGIGAPPGQRVRGTHMPQCCTQPLAPSPHTSSGSMVRRSAGRSGCRRAGRRASCGRAGSARTGAT